MMIQNRQDLHIEPDEDFLPNRPPMHIGYRAQLVWQTTYARIDNSGHNRMQYIIEAIQLAQAYRNYIAACGAVEESRRQQQRERLFELREPVRRLMNEFGIDELPYIEEEEQFKAARFWARLQLHQVEYLISHTVAETEKWQELLEQQAELHKQIGDMQSLIEGRDREGGKQ